MNVSGTIDVCVQLLDVINQTMGTDFVTNTIEDLFAEGQSK